MKVSRQPRERVGRHPLARVECIVWSLAIVAGSLLNASRSAAQTNGVWANTAASGNWGDAINWQGGNVADGTGATADFSQQTMTNNITVHLNSSHSIGNVVFGDLGNTYNWTVDSAGVLSLATPLATPVIGTAQPMITVDSGTATISAVISGTQGFVLNPNGGTGTLVLSGANTFYDGPVQSNAPNGGYGGITIDGGTLSIASDVPTGTYALATPSPLGYFPTENSPFPDTSAWPVPAAIVINGGALQATGTFELSPLRGIALGSAAGGGGGTINVTSGNVLTYGYDAAIDSAYNAGSPPLHVGGVISDYNIGSSLTLTGGGTLLLTGVNTYTGPTNINGAGCTLEAGVANAISRFSAVSVASSATFLLNGFSQSVGSLAGAGSVTNNTSAGTNVTLTLGSDNTSPTFSGALSNTTGANSDIFLAIIKGGTGYQTLSTSTGATWAATGTGGGYDLAGPASGAAPVVAVNGGALTLDMSRATTQTNMLNPYYALQLGGGTLALNEAASSSGTVQAFNGTTVNSGGSAVVVMANGNTSATGFQLGAITRNTGGTVDFTPGSSTTGNISTTNATASFLGGWATVAGTDWAAINGSGNIVALTSAGGIYTNDVWLGGNNTTVTVSSSPASGSTTNSVRFNAAGPTAGGFSVALTGANHITSGGILVTSAAGANGATIAGGGSLTSGNGSDLIVQQFDSGGPLTIGAQIAGSGIGLTKSGPGTLALTDSANSYTGGTTVNAGTLSISADGDLGSTAGAVVLNGGTLHAAGAAGSSFALSSSRGIVLGPVSGVGNGTIDVAAGVTFNVPGPISNNGTSTSSLTKTGAGTLILPNGDNSFSGGFYLNQGITVANPLIDSQQNLGIGTNAINFTGNSTLQMSVTPDDMQSGGYINNIVIGSGVTATLDLNTGKGGVNSNIFQGIVVGTGALTIMSSSGSADATHVLFYADSNYGIGGNFVAQNWSYTGPSTIYNANFALGWTSYNGASYTTQLNPKNVLNLGGTLFTEISSTPGEVAAIQTLATQINLIPDTSSQINGDPNQGYNTRLQAGCQIYLNSAASNGIVRNAGSTFAIDPSTMVYVANGAVANTNGIIGGWATTGITLNGNLFSYSAAVGGTDWAVVGAGGQIVPLSSVVNGYTNDAWAAGNNTTVTQNDDFSPSGSNMPNLTSNSLRFVSLTTTSGASVSQTLTLAGANLLQSGGILVTTNESIAFVTVHTINGDYQVPQITPGTDVSHFTIAGGTLTSGNGSDLIVNQFNPLLGSSLTIASQIVNNGATAIGLTLAGNTTPDPVSSPAAIQGGLLILTNPANSYTGPTVINATTTLQAGAANVIPHASAVIISGEGTLNLNGFNQSIGSLANIDQAALSSLNSSEGYALLSSSAIGFGTTVTAGTSFGSGSHVIILTVGNDNTSTQFNGALTDGNANNLLALAKVGSGTLTLGNFSDNISSGTINLSNFSGGTVITAGTLDILQDADLGAVPASPTQNVTFNGNSGTPTLQLNSVYNGTSISTNRGIVVNANDVGYVDTNGNPLITYAGLLTVGASGTFGKAGAGIFELDAPPNLGVGSTISVSGGTLRLKYSSGATLGTNITASVSGGATLELAGSVSQLSQSVNIVNSGTLLDSSSGNQNVGAVTGSGNTVVNSGGMMTAYQIRQNSLTISGNAKVTLLPSGSGSVGNPTGPNNINFSSSVTSLTLGGSFGAWTGTLDIGNNGLVIAYGGASDPYSTVQNMIESGYNGGVWGGTGITSSLAAANIHGTHPLNIGLVDFTPGMNHDATFIVFGGQTITTNAILVRLTYMDDLVLSGDMSEDNATSDALLFAANFGTSTTWGTGNLTHANVPNGGDYTSDALLFAANYGVGFPSLDGTTGAAATFGGNTSAVPEPESILLAALGILGLGLTARRSMARRADTIKRG